MFTHQVARIISNVGMKHYDGCRSARDSSGQGDCKLKLNSNVVAFQRNEKIASDSSVRAGDTVVHR